jgi:hypothetical protein
VLLNAYDFPSDYKVDINFSNSFIVYKQIALTVPVSTVCMSTFSLHNWEISFSNLLPLTGLLLNIFTVLLCSRLKC